MNILHLLPRVPPAVCGIGDYAWSIARGLRDEHDIHSQFLSAGTSWTAPQGETEFPVFRLPALTAETLVDFVRARAGEWDAIILHLSPYGFQQRGVPLWLARGWRHLSQLSPRPRLLTMFHELYASGPLNSSAFWLQPWQKGVLRIVARASDGLRTNRQAYADWLRKIAGLKARTVEVMPVFSNLGEPEILPPWSEREPAMAMFAWGIHSGESLEEVVRKAADNCRRFGMKRLHLLGWEKIRLLAEDGVEIVRHGFLAASAVSELLASCQMAYTAYSPEHFGKSTLVAAFAAHGLATITQGKEAELPDGLRDSIEVLHESFPKEGLTSERLSSIGHNLRVWYEGHSLKANTRSYAAQISGMKRPAAG